MVVVPPSCVVPLCRTISKASREPEGSGEGDEYTTPLGAARALSIFYLSPQAAAEPQQKHGMRARQTSGVSLGKQQKAKRAQQPRRFVHTRRCNDVVSCLDKVLDQDDEPVPEVPWTNCITEPWLGGVQLDEYVTGNTTWMGNFIFH